MLKAEKCFDVLNVFSFKIQNLSFNIFLSGFYNRS
jgi:hypothetical protein